MFRRPQRQVHAVFLHCSASDDEALAGAGLLREIERWHLARGFSGIGYHFVIDKNGVLMRGRDTEATPAAQQNFNKGTLAICVHGLAKEKFTDAALATAQGLCDQINHAYRGNIVFRGHCEVSAKSCPVFDFRALLQLDKGGKMPLELKKGPSK